MAAGIAHLPGAGEHLGQEKSRPTASRQQTVEKVCRRTMRRSPTMGNLGFSIGRQSGKRPWMAFSTDS
jgi:hypothetical protein